MKLLDEQGVVSEEFHTIIENTNDLVFLKNRDSVYIAVSKTFAADCVGAKLPEDILGKTDYDLFEEKLARRYQESDRELFASGESKRDYQEVLQGDDGKKHLCLTTKYVLHDREGMPIGIFGQYHDIDSHIKEEIKRRSNLSRNAEKALSSVYFAVNYCDLTTHTFTILKSVDYSHGLVATCPTMEEALESFIQGLVRPEFQEKIREFCNTDTIAERLRDKKKIDSEYLSKVAKGWCRVSFIAAERDENGEVTHCLFAVSAIDTANAKVIEEGFSSKFALESIFDEVPGGIVEYEWDGKALTVLRMSKYYKDLYGYSMQNETGKPDYQRIHPDDREEYQKTILQALNGSHELEYVFRVWNNEKNCYLWTKVDAVSKPQSDGTSLVYAMYSDVTAQKQAELRLKKSNASIMAALGATEQFIYEYDPVEHVSTGFLREDIGYDLEPVIENYPECFRESGFIHPEDVEYFIETVHEIDDGQDRAKCEVRVKKGDTYRWHSCYFEAFYDSEKERRIALLTVVDITPQKTALQSYENRLQMLIRANEDAMCMCDINLSKNTFFNVRAKSVIKGCSEKANSLDELMQFAAEGVFDKEERESYLATFNCEQLLSLYRKGQSHISVEHFYRISENHTEWVETVFDLVTDPTSGEVLGISYAKSLNETRMSRFLLDAALDKDYPAAALVYAETGEYYLYETGKNEHCTHLQDYWNVISKRLPEIVSEDDAKRVRKHITKEKVLGALSVKNEYTYTFDTMSEGKPCRMEAKFFYVDKKHNLLLATLRDINDVALYRKYKYESEHDSVTGLLNRASVFRKCRRLLEEYPEERFVMLHGDVRHFHLYNTFFGDKGGDKLLRFVADILRKMGEDYDHWAYGRIEADVFCAFFPYDEVRFKKHMQLLLEEISKFNHEFLIEPVLGLYFVADPSISIEAMFTRATIAAKSGSNNIREKISRFDEDMEKELEEKQEIMAGMQNALENEEFQVYLQPKYSLATTRIVGAEALVRWIHPEKGVISPGKFIPIFESNGFITTLDHYVWESVCKMLRRWQNEGRVMYPVSVNVSRISMYLQSTVPFLKDLVTRYALDPKYLELELTETAYMDDPKDLKRMLSELKDFGFTILMDDFGSGFSSLNTLRELPVDILKLDRKFLTESQSDDRGNAVLSSVIRMSKRLHLPIVAEGVETVEQADYLFDMGCEYVQGFLFAKPMPISEFEDLIGVAKE